MKDNIESKIIGNRKIIIEIRFDHKPLVADKKGIIIEGIKSLNLFPIFHWEMGTANFSIFDNAKKEEASNLIRLGLDQFALISSNIGSIEGFYNNFTKIYAIIKKELEPLNIRRIGCRILGTYKTKSKDFNSILNSIKQGFPSMFYLDKYPAKDLMFQVNYPNGMYNIGPVNEHNDPFVEANFHSSNRKEHVGIAIDTDNYLTNEKEPINDEYLIKNIYQLSLSVEKDLYINLKDC